MKRWLWGEGHCHSEFSDGFHNMKELTELCEEYELDFRFQTATTAKHTVIPGAEFGLQFKPGPWTLNRFFDHHILIRSLKENNFPEEKKLSGKWWPEMWYECAKKARNKISMAHVSDNKTPWQALPELENLSSLEIILNMENNEPIENRQWLSWWDYMLSQGKRIVLTTGSDAHQGDLWMAGSMRNVVCVEGNPTKEKISKALHSGRSYLSGTYHPDIWKELGEKGIAPERNSFTPWFGIKDGISRKEASEKVWKWIDKGIKNNHGRIRKKDFPEMKITVDGASPGEEIHAKQGKSFNLDIEIKMNVPISQISLIAMGESIWNAAPLKKDFRKKINLKLDKDIKYLRIVATGNGKKKSQKETLISNPIWVV
jgi:hypothetical protein